MKRRIGFIGIIIEDRKNTAPEINNILTSFGDIILARMGVPHIKGEHFVITLIIDATTDELGALTGKLGTIDNVSIKSSLSKS